MKIFYFASINKRKKNAPIVHVNEICKNLQILGNKIILYLPEEKYGRNIFLNALSTVKYQFKIFYKFFFKIQSGDVIYCRHCFDLIMPFILSKIKGASYITEINGNTTEELKISKIPKFIIFLSRLFEKVSYNFADRIIVVTPSIKDYLIKEYKVSPSKIFVLENGVDIELFKPERLKQKYDLVFVGNIAHWQGLEYLIKAIPLVKREKSNIKVAIIGEGSETENLKNLTKELNLNSNILFLGAKNHNKISRYINQTSICVAPFLLNERNKKTGISAFKLYEYASCGKPIITTKISGAFGFIKKNKCGLLVEPNNHKQIADAIIKFLKNPKTAKKMGKNGREAILNGYSWKNVAEKTDKIIKEV